MGVGYKKNEWVVGVTGALMIFVLANKVPLKGLELF